MVFVWPVPARPDQVPETPFWDDGLSGAEADGSLFDEDEESDLSLSCKSHCAMQYSSSSHPVKATLAQMMAANVQIFVVFMTSAQARPLRTAGCVCAEEHSLLLLDRIILQELLHLLVLLVEVNPVVARLCGIDNLFLDGVDFGRGFFHSHCERDLALALH